MLSAPWYAWLAPLVVPPIVWWLHRSGWAQRRMEVTALFLWQPVSQSGAPTQQQRAQPIWLLRAVVCTALLLALAGISWQPRGGPVTVWFDDSLSMLTREQATTRVHLALERVDAELHGRSATLRFLRDPMHSLAVGARASSHAAAVQARAGSDSTLAPGAAIVGTPGEHWLITDGADPHIHALLETTGFHRSMLVGKASENVAITDLRLRRSLRHDHRAHGLARVVNAGFETAVRDLSVYADGVLLLQRRLELAPDQQQTVSFELDAGAGRVTAMLNPGDALPEDDMLSTDATPLAPVPVAARGACPGSLLRALASHPGLRLATSAVPPQLTIACADDGGLLSELAPAAPAVRVHLRSDYAASGQLLEWSGPHQWLPRFVSGPVGAGAAPAGDPAASVLLRDAASNTTLLAAKHGYLDVYLDLTAQRLPDEVDYLALVNAILASTAAPVVLDPIPGISRSVEGARIAPQQTSATAAAPSSPGSPPRQLTHLLILLAALLIAADLLQAWRPRQPLATTPA